MELTPVVILPLMNERTPSIIPSESSVVVPDVLLIVRSLKADAERIVCVPAPLSINFELPPFRLPLLMILPPMVKIRAPAFNVQPAAIVMLFEMFQSEEGLIPETWVLATSTSLNASGVPDRVIAFAPPN